jgi:hypothetical protein
MLLFCLLLWLFFCLFLYFCWRLGFGISLLFWVRRGFYSFFCANSNGCTGCCLFSICNFLWALYFIDYRSFWVIVDRNWLMLNFLMTCAFFLFIIFLSFFFLGLVFIRFLFFLTSNNFRIACARFCWWYYCFRFGILRVIRMSNF